MSLKGRHLRDKIFRAVSFALTFFVVMILAILIYHVMKEGWQWLDTQFLTSYPSRRPSRAGLKSALYGTIWVISLTGLIAVPLGVATAVFLEEYSPKNTFTQMIQMNIANLAGMPSIVYGLIGLAIFVRFFGLDRSIWSGALTLSLLILPIIIIATQGALRAVPNSIRLAGYALGARKWQVVFGQVLPAALPGIMTGVILSLSRAIGETAPLIMIGALSFVAFVPEGPSDAFTVLPVQIYNWAERPQADFHGIAAAGIIVLLLILFSFNFVAVFIRNHFQRYK